jgi:beta-galactosidase/beta-glucuronidase
MIAAAKHPRPDFLRERWTSLDGDWEFAFDDADKGRAERWEQGQAPLPLRIRVPFCYQSPASGIGDGTPHQTLWYRRTFDLPDELRKARVFLRFGAVDYRAQVWLNGIALGGHEGGYDPFSFDISDFVRESGNVLTVRAEDRYDPAQPRGKQHWTDGGSRCWYTAVSGIWQSVWLEGTDGPSITVARLEADAESGSLAVRAELDGAPEDCELLVDIQFGGTPVASASFRLSGPSASLALSLGGDDPVDDLRRWSPENPVLYDAVLSVRKAGRTVDTVHTQFGLRSLGVKDGRFLLNGTPYRQRLVLDQGYWPETLLTPPSEEAIIADIELAKKLGFNGARKHQKAEDPRYYYWADRLGFLVWAEAPSAYEYTAASQKALMRDAAAIVGRDANHPSIVAWVPLNESWGVRRISNNKRQQDFSVALYRLLRALDGTRPIVTNDGWEMTETDFCGVHDYSENGHLLSERTADLEELVAGTGRPGGNAFVGNRGRRLFAEGYSYGGQPIFLSEFGGIALMAEGEVGWGYSDIERSKEDFTTRFAGLFAAVKTCRALDGFCYTQLTDVFQERNGLLDMNRKSKVDPELVRRIVGGS